MSMFKSSYRTYVLNDFSAVSKAVFYVLEKDKTIGNYKLIDKLPVQINPDKISGKVGETRNVFIKSVDGSGEEYLGAHKRAEGDNEYTIELKYDIYDEYNVRTMNGLSNADLVNDMSLFKEDTATLERLKILSCDFESFVLFLWGDIQIFGRIKEVEFDYTAFSRWGNPLKAEAKVTIEKEHLGFNIGQRTEIKPLDKMDVLVKSAIEGYQKAETAMITAATAIDALR